jgi:hypothetical protein
MTIAPTQDTVQIALRTFLLAVLPAGVDAIIAVVNRVPEPSAPKFVIISPTRFARLRTNIDTAADVKFTGSIAGTVLTVSAVAFGTIRAGAILFGVGVAAPTQILVQLTGSPGGTGTYTVSPGQTIGSETLASGAKLLEQGAQVTVQLDFHTDDNSAADLAQTVSTIFRDEAGVQLFADQNLGVTPLFADDARYLPFINENQQFEWRWVVEANLQVNQVVSVPQQYADVVSVTVINVDAAHPP